MKNLSSSEYQTMQNVLNEIKPYVLVVGSVARSQDDMDSDIDLYIKTRTEADMDRLIEENDFSTEGIEETYITEVVDILQKHGLKVGSMTVGYIHTNTLDTQIEASYLFKVEEGAETFNIDVYGVEMDATIDSF